MTDYDLTEYRVLKVWAEMFFDTQESRKRTVNRIGSAPVFPDLFAEELVAAETNEHRIKLEMVRQYRRTAPAGVIAWQKAAPGIGQHLLARLLGHLGHPRIATPSHWEGTGAERKLIPDEPHERTVAQLRQYCGHGRAGRPQKGMSAEDLAALGSPSLKMLTHLLAECAIREPGRSIDTLLETPTAVPYSRASAASPFFDSPIPIADDTNSSASRSSAQQPTHIATPMHPAAAGQPFPGSNPPATSSGFTGRDPLGTVASPQVPNDLKSVAGVWPYRVIYEHRRLLTASRVHTDPCIRCGPGGKPAMPESPWSRAHAQADALRIVGKAILQDLWTAAAE